MANVTFFKVGEQPRKGRFVNSCFSWSIDITNRNVRGFPSHDGTQ